MSIKSLLLKQYKLYPKMQIQDMVKLIYQNEFAGGHLITNEIDSLKRLQEEYRSLKECPPDRSIPVDTVFEDIGNGLCKFHLSALGSTGINLTTLNRFFISTANSISGSIQRFEKKLEVFKQCCKDKTLPYSLAELEAYLEVYKSHSYPQVRHSENYRVNYSPAYRIVKVEYKDFFEIFRKVDSLLKSQDTVYLAIDGNSCAGKSTLASLLSDVYDCNVFHMDHFFLRPELKTEERLKEVGGNVDYVRFKQEVITGLQSGHEFRYQIYDCAKKALTEYVSILPKKLNIIEGVYSMHPSLIDSYDLKIFLRVEEREQSIRILKRNGAFMHERFLCEWIPMENRYFKEMKIQKQCDLVFER